MTIIISESRPQFLESQSNSLTKDDSLLLTVGYDQLSAIKIIRTGGKTHTLIQTFTVYHIPCSLFLMFLPSSNQSCYN